MDLTLIDISAIFEIPPDITFKFTQVNGGEIKANKTILAMVSKVFRNMFFIHNTMDKSATEMVMEDTTKPAFQIMIDAIYKVRPMKESLQEKSVDEVFAVLYLVIKYEIPKLLQTIKNFLSSFPITEDNVLEVATIATKYSPTFEESAQILLLACAKFLKPKAGDGGSFVRFVAKNGDQMVTLHKLAVLMDDMDPSPTSSDWCHGCQRVSTECLNGKMVRGNNVKVGVKVTGWRHSNEKSYSVGFVVGKDERKNDYWIGWKENDKRGKYYIGDISRFKFKCR